MTFEDLVRGHDSRLHSLLQKSVWRVNAGRSKFYCSLKFRHGDLSGWRYDADLMFPSNGAAIEVHSVLRQLVKREDTGVITWSGSKAAVLLNWTTLHGRGPEPPSEGIRVIERLYVR